MTPVDILYVIPRPEIGGAEHQLLKLLSRIDRRHYRPHVVCLESGGSLLPRFEALSESVHVLNRSRSLDVATLLSLVEILRNIRPAIVHTWLYIANIYGGFASRLAGVPLLVVSHRGLCFDPRHTRLKRLLIPVFNFITSLWADRLLVNAKAVAELLWRSGFHPEETRIVANGVEPGSPSGSFALDIPEVEPDDILLGSITKVDPKKDLETMLRAFASVLAEEPRARLLIIGGGQTDYREKLNQMAEALKIHPRVHFLGFRSDAQEILSRCRICLLSSVTEGLPNAILESMQLGKPVVATRVGGVPEMVRDGIEGYLVPCERADLFADRILNLLRNADKAARMGAAGRRRVLDQFGMDRMVRSTEKVYSDLLGEHGISERPERPFRAWPVAGIRLELRSPSGRLTAAS